MKDTIRMYYMIFRKDAQGNSYFQFIVESEAVADQFCSDFPDLFYISRDEFMRFLRESAANKAAEEQKEATPDERVNNE